MDSGKIGVYREKLKVWLKSRCDSVTVRMNKMKTSKRKMTIVIIFFIGLLFLIIQTLVAYSKIVH